MNNDVEWMMPMDYVLRYDATYMPNSCNWQVQEPDGV